MNKKYTLSSDDEILRQLLQIGSALGGLKEKDLMPDAPARPKGWTDIFSEGAGRLGLPQENENVSDAVARNVGGVYDMITAPTPDFIRNNLAAGGAQTYGSIGEAGQFLGRQFGSQALQDAGASMNETGNRLQQANTPADNGILGEVVQQLPFMATTLIPGLGVGGLAAKAGIAGAKALGVAGNAARLAKIGSTAGAIGSGATQATIEALMEAGNKSNEYLKEHPEDIEGANEVGRTTLAGNIGLLTASDTAQAMLMFKRFRKGYDTVSELVKKSPTVAKLMSVPGMKTGLNLGSQMLLEANEEAQQTNIGDFAQGKETNIMPWNWSEGQKHEAMVAGLSAGLIGGGVKVANGVSNMMKPAEEQPRTTAELEQAALPVEAIPAVTAQTSPDLGPNVSFVNNQMAHDIDAINQSLGYLGMSPINSAEEVGNVIPELAKRANEDPLQTTLKFMQSRPEAEMREIVSERLKAFGVDIAKDTPILELAKLTTSTLKDKLGDKFNAGEVGKTLNTNWTESIVMTKDRQKKEKEAQVLAQAELVKMAEEAKAVQATPVAPVQKTKPVPLTGKFANLKEAKQVNDDEKQSRSNVSFEGDGHVPVMQNGEYTKEELAKRKQELPPVSKKKAIPAPIIKGSEAIEIPKTTEGHVNTLTSTLLEKKTKLQQVMNNRSLNGVELLKKEGETADLYNHYETASAKLPSTYHGEVKFYGKSISEKGYVKKIITDVGVFLQIAKENYTGKDMRGTIEAKSKDGKDYVLVPTHAVHLPKEKSQGTGAQRGMLSAEDSDVIRDIQEIANTSMEGTGLSTAETFTATRDTKMGLRQSNTKIDVSVDKLEGLASEKQQVRLGGRHGRAVKQYLVDNNITEWKDIQKVLDVIKEFNSTGSRLEQEDFSGMINIEDIIPSLDETKMEDMVTKIVHLSELKDISNFNEFKAKVSTILKFKRNETTNDKGEKQAVVVDEYGKKYVVPAKKEDLTRRELEQIVSKVVDNYKQSIIAHISQNPKVNQFVYKYKEISEYKGNLKAVFQLVHDAINESFTAYPVYRAKARAEGKYLMNYWKWIQGFKKDFPFIRNTVMDAMGRKDRREIKFRKMEADFEKSFGRKPIFLATRNNEGTLVYKKPEDIEYFKSLFNKEELERGSRTVRNQQATPITPERMHRIAEMAQERGKTVKEFIEAKARLGEIIQDKSEKGTNEEYFKNELYKEVPIHEDLNNLRSGAYSLATESLDAKFEKEQKQLDSSESGTEVGKEATVGQVDSKKDIDEKFTFGAAETRADRKIAKDKAKEFGKKTPINDNVSQEEAEEAFDNALPVSNFRPTIYTTSVDNKWYGWTKGGAIWHITGFNQEGKPIIRPLNRESSISKKMRENIKKYGNPAGEDKVKYSRTNFSTVNVESAPVSKKSGTEDQIIGLAKILGIKEIQFYDETPNDNGYYSNGIIHVNRNSTKASHWVIAHELLHHMTTQYKGGVNLYKMIANTVNPNHKQIIDYIKDHFPKDISKYVEIKDGQESLIQGKYGEIKEEMIADEIANQLHDPAFWKKINAEQPGIIKRVYDHIVQFIHELIGKNGTFHEKQDSHLSWSNDAGTRSQIDQVIDSLADVILATKGVKTVRASVEQMADKKKFIDLIDKGNWTKEEKEFMATKYSELMSAPETNPASFLWLANRIHESQLSKFQMISHILGGFMGKDKFNVYSGHSDGKVTLLEYVFGSPFYRALKSPRFAKYYNIYKNTEVMLKRRLDEYMGTLDKIYKKISPESKETIEEIRFMTDERHREHFQAQETDTGFVILNPEDRRVAVKHWKSDDEVEHAMVSREVIQMNFPEFDFSKEKYYDLDKVKEIIASKEGWRVGSFTTSFTNQEGNVEKATTVFATQDKESKKRYTKEEAISKALGQTRDYLESEYNKEVADAYKEIREHYNSLANEANIARKRFGLAPLGWIDGYLPHMFAKYVIMKKVENSNKIEPVRYFDTLAEATSWIKTGVPEGQQRFCTVTANSFSAKTKQATPYMFNEDFLTEAEQGEFGRIINQRDIMETFMKGNQAEGTFKERYWAQSKKRYSSAGGWMKNLEMVDRRYTEGLVRWTYLNNMNIEVTDQYKKDFDDDITSATTDLEKRWIQDIYHEMNSKPTLVESAMMDWINKPDNVQIKMTLEHFLGTRPFQSGANLINEVTAVSKLGMFNISSVFLQATQMGNTYAVVGGKNFAVGMAQAKKLLAVTGRDFKKIKELYTSYQYKIEHQIKPSEVEEIANIIYEAKVDVDVAIDGDEIYSYSAKEMHINSIKDWAKASTGQKLRSFGQTSLYAFRKLDQITRMVSVLAGYNKAITENSKISPADAYKKAEEVNTMANFQYGKFDTPRALQFLGPVGQVLFQFKKYMFKEIQLIDHISPNFNPMSPKFYQASNWKKPEFARFMMAQTLLAGLGGVPFMQVMNTIMGAFGWEPDKEMRKYLMTNLPNDGIGRAMALQMMYGSFAAIPDAISKGNGVDLSKRLGTSDIIPNNMSSLLLGPTVSTITQFFKAVTQNWGNLSTVAPEIVGTIAPYPGGLLRAMAGEERSLTDKQRVSEKYDLPDVLARLGGFRPLTVAINSDKVSQLKAIQEERRTDREGVIVNALALREEDKPMTPEVMEGLRKYKITPKMLAEENKKRYKEKLERVKANLPKDLRKTPDVVSIANF